MACQVKILAVLGQLSGSVLTAIKVVGTGSACDAVVITILCGAMKRNIQAQIISGAWSVSSAVLAGEPFCGCDQPIQVIAECVTGACKDTFSGTLACQQVSRCPDIYITPDDEMPCRGNGTRVVQGTVTVSVDPSNAVGVTISVDNITIASHAPSNITYSVPFSTPLGPGSHPLKVVPSDPACGASGVVINVAPCPGFDRCPAVELQPLKEGECRDNRRIAEVSVLVTPAPGTQVDATLSHGATQLDSESGQTGPFFLTGTDSFVTGGDTVVVNVTRPDGCPARTIAINTKPCSFPPNGGDGGDDGGGGFGCIIGRILVALLLATALFLALVAACVPAAAPWILIAAVAAAAIGVIALGLWLLLCGTRCGALLITWQVMMIGAWVSAYMGACCIAGLVLAIGLGLASLALFGYWVSSCKPSKCRLLLELLWVHVTAVGPILSMLASIAPCGLTVVATVAGLLAAIFAAAAAATCP